MTHDFLRLGSRITLLPIVHGSGDFAIAVRQALLNEPCDCLAVPLPPSFQPAVEEAIGQLPAISAVVQVESREFDREWDPAAESNEEETSDRAVNYVPIDPCQGVITALRMAMSERIPRAFIDLETAKFEPRTAVCPDPYALKRLSIGQFAAA
ncbi:MAG TPA: hypothetical protein VHB77_15695, partial [Planctomycetaceae bacterium]|nr:hypothetical protein [Planctomycetaceae bacterium]